MTTRRTRVSHLRTGDSQKLHILRHNEDVTKVRPKPAAPPSPPRPARRWWPDLWICLLLLAATLAVYSQVRHFDFVNYDDPDHASQNVHVRAGLTSEGLAWALTSGDYGNWFPVTRLSYLIDYQLFGLDAGMLHLTNLLFHALTTLLVFALFRRMTGARWRSAFVAFIFALHPLHVESVAWIAERKDVLSGFFWFAALLAYVHYVRRPSLGRYLLVVAPFCLGLMAKPVVVTLPFALLLLDVWPLGRIPLNAKPKAGVFWEKAPLLALSIGSSVVTYVVQSGAGVVGSLDAVPLARRFGNVVVSYIVYILKMLWPTRLAVFYPYAAELPAWQVGAAALALLTITFIALRWVRRRPWFAVGWFWYLGTLVPMIGLVQVGAASHADRYTYLPAVGLWIVLAWGAAELVERWPRAKPAVAGLAAAGCAACLCLTWIQVRYWENSITLFRHAIQVTSGSYLAHNNLGNALMGMGRLPDAIAEFEAALRIQPGYADTHFNLGIALENIAPAKSPGRLSDAIAEYQAALRAEPGYVKAHVNLGAALARIPERVPDAIAELQTAIRLQPDSAKAHECLGGVLSRLPGRLPDAIAEFQAALRIDPNSLELHYQLAYALAQTPGRLSEAIAECQETLRIAPNNEPGRELMASLLAYRNGRGR